jgi:hypothetical protein
MLKVWSSAWGYWKVIEPLRGGAEREVSGHRGVSSKGILGHQSLSLFASRLA